MFLFCFAVTLIGISCFAEDDISKKVTDEAIDARIAGIRMGDILVKTKPGADVRIEQVRHEFLYLFKAFKLTFCIKMSIP